MVLGAISDPHRRKIIGVIKDDFKSVNQIVEETGLPPSTVYRKIDELHNKKLLILSGKIGNNGRKEFNYKSKIQKVTMTFENNTLDLKIYTNLRD